MKKLSLLLIGFLLIPSLLFTSCDRGEDPGSGTTLPAFELMRDHMIASNLDVDKILVNPDGEKFVVGAPGAADYDAFIAKYYILDIRSSDAFNNSGHIKGAKNIAFGDILTEAENAGGKPILMVCYTGQTACYATSLLRLYGYSHTRALKWGMSGWNDATAGPWNSNTGDIAKGDPNWAYSSPPSNSVFDDPSLSSLSQDGAEILKDRIKQVIQEGFKTVAGQDVLDNPGDYFVNNYFNAADYGDFGHITNAFRINPFHLADNTYKAFQPGSKIATYCYTGQTSAVLTAYLRVLGYDAYSLTFGMNGLYHSNPAWKTNQWGVGSSVPKNLPLIK
jgi:rhodanese-related sulfurtransferase